MGLHGGVHSCKHPYCVKTIHSIGIPFFCENYESVKTSSRGIFMLVFIKELHGGLRRCESPYYCHISEIFIKKHFRFSVRQGLRGGVCRHKYQYQVVIMHSILSASIYCIKLYSGKQNFYILFTTTFKNIFFDKKWVNYDSKYGMYPIRKRTFYSFIQSARP